MGLTSEMTLIRNEQPARMSGCSGGGSVDFKQEIKKETKSRCRVPISTLAGGEDK